MVENPSLAAKPALWTYEEQFKQLYELDEDPKRKEFLDDLFSFMQKRGTPVNRIPIMAKQVLDLYTLYRLVTDKGGLVEVINKKIWREITKGLNLPTSITSAAFTLRTQYMKYLYPYECEKRALSSPGELQAAIDSNRREGRRQTFGTALFNYSPAGTPTLLGSPKMPLPALSISTHSCSQLSQVHTIKKEDGVLAAAVPGRIAIPVGLAGHHLAAAQAAAASQAAVLEQLREKLETGEPPEKKVALTVEEQQRLVQHALQHNLLAVASQFPMNVKISNRDDRQETALNLSTNGISSINMSIEINGVVYTGNKLLNQTDVKGGMHDMVADELVKVQVALSNIAGKKERIKILFKKIEDVIKYLDPQYIDRMAVPDAMKLQFILAEEQVIPSRAALLEQVKNLQPILDSTNIQAVPDHAAKLQRLSQIHIQQQEQRQDLTNGVKKLLEDYNKMTLLLSKQFIQWNEILTQLEAAKEAKPAAE
ncbi:AT-rich interactive domain-containing protein 3C [Patagioenas fasciata monilis]|uniref:AT-rich interactive domain-containing protein 3 n=1 Tax=Patagioenas fasciata monilis TaxID=372326 RepID=A0A1V4JTB0_PATFA|nr:AT-rich interactive domain-containing protein 3C [Patagioenas fasciata monilis]